MSQTTYTDSNLKTENENEVILYIQNHVSIWNIYVAIEILQQDFPKMTRTTFCA